MSEIRDGLIGKRFEVAGLGAVSLLDVMGDDAAVCDAARRTIRKARKLSEDRDLIRYMLRHSHATPFEMCEVKLFVEMPLVFKNQMIRHRAAAFIDSASMWDEPSVNEFSGRYSEFEDRFYATAPDGWRKQAESNRQGSDGTVTEWPPDYRSHMAPPDEWATPGKYLAARERDLQQQAREVYEERLRFGVAREQARKDLPVSQVTEFVWKCDLRNVLGFLALRMDSHAQAEIQAYAQVIAYQIVAKLFPITFGAFDHYVLRSLTLSALDIDAIRRIPFDGIDAALKAVFANVRERGECLVKLDRLNLIPEARL